MKFRKRYGILGAIALGYLFSSFPIYYLIGDSLHLMLAWNILLAAIPMVLAWVIESMSMRRGWVLVVLLTLWTLFFPNTFYVITDLIYLDRLDFFSDNGFADPLAYHQNLLAYLQLFHIVTGVLIGIALGLVSLESISRSVLFPKLRKYQWIGLVGLFVLSGIGIYIGRFYRYNSWEIWNIPMMIRDFFRHFSWFTVFFISAFMVIQCLCYGLFRLLTMEKS